MRIAIVNRGEPALRLIRAARDEGSHIRTIALYTEPDTRALFVREADEAYLLGPARAYLDYAALEHALRSTRATHAWVGWGFVAEHPDFADLCARIGVTFIGPTAQAMRTLGDKIASKDTADAAGVPTTPWSRVSDLADGQAKAERIGYPLMIKATAGGGGRGIRMVSASADFATAFASATSEAQKAFGNGEVYIEKRIDRARHAEVQIVADKHGTVWAAGVRDCTLQRRHQKVIEEAPGQNLPSQALCDAAVKLAKATGYQNVGTVEFLVLGENFYFMEMNTRLQVEHPITEVTTGLDLVRLQLKIAAGEKLPPTPPPTQGYAIEARLNVEDPERDFAPAPGTLTLLRFPGGPGVRVDSGYTQGDTVPNEFDSMAAKIIASGTTRQEALLRLRRALAEMRILVSGGASNRAFLCELLDHQDVQAGAIDTAWLDRQWPTRATAPSPFAWLALCVGAIQAHATRRNTVLSDFLVAAKRGRGNANDDPPRDVTLRAFGGSFTLTVLQRSADQYEVIHGAARYSLHVDKQTTHEWLVRTHEGAQHAVAVLTEKEHSRIEVGGFTHRVDLPSGDVVTAPAPGLVLQLHVHAGDTVKAGDHVATLEAMKTEMAVRANAAGIVKRVHVSAGMQVISGATLFELDASGTTADTRETGLAWPGANDTPLDPLALLTIALRGYDLGEQFDALGHCRTLSASERFPRVLALLQALSLAPSTEFYTQRGFQRAATHAPTLAQILALDRPESKPDAWRAALERLLSQSAFSELADVAAQLRFADYERPALLAEREAAYKDMDAQAQAILQRPKEEWIGSASDALAHSPDPLLAFSMRWPHELMLVLFLKRFYGMVHAIAPIRFGEFVETRFKSTRVLSAVVDHPQAKLESISTNEDTVVDLVVRGNDVALDVTRIPRHISRVTLIHGTPLKHTSHARTETGWRELTELYDVHPLMAERLELARLAHFELKRLPAASDVYLLSAKAKGDQRLFAFAHVRHPERMETQLLEAVHAMSEALFRWDGRPPMWNRIIIHLWQPVQPDTMTELLDRLAPRFASLNLEKLVIRTGTEAIHFGFDGRRFVRVRSAQASPHPIRTLSAYQQKVVLLRRRGLTYPYEIIRMLTPSEQSDMTPAPKGHFVELELVGEALQETQRPYGENVCGIVVGRITHFTRKHPEGMRRIILLGDPSIDMGSLAEPECRRIIAAIDLAAREQIPLEWYPVSAGAAITMQSGTENLDWTARVLKRIIEHTQAGGEINVIVDAISVGAQSYWNAEATMLQHTRGALIMTPNGAMVLTGKKALEFSGGVSAEDHQGIGGLKRIMGPNGEAHYAAKDLADACRILFRYYTHTYVAPGETAVRQQPTTDAGTRNVGHSPYAYNTDFAFVGDVFTDAHNPGRKKSFDIRTVMQAVIDADSPPLERWAQMRDAEMAVVWDAHLGGISASIIAIESRNTDRQSFVPADGPESFSGATLFPLGSKKVARAINAASGRRPVVVLANLSGFDGSPESLRKLQLEYGAEIGRAVVNFKGTFVFIVLSRYHGGAYVVFSKALNPALYSAALEGSYASVIGGAPAAAVVFRHEVTKRVKADPRAREHYADVEREKLAEVAQEFDAVHSVGRAKQVGSIDDVISVAALREELVRRLRNG